MFLQKLHLFNFKNYAETSLDFSSRVNVLVGKNGSGKTNLLDAIHYLSLTRSAFCADNYAIRMGEQFFFVKGFFQSGRLIEEISCSIQTGSKKVFKEGVNEYSKLSDHVGKYPVVLIAPDDTQLVKEGSEDRRKFFDSIISQLDRQYLEALIQYNYALRQRNSMLKMFAETNSFDGLALESYDQVLTKSGDVIFQKRKQFITEFIPVFQKYYQFIVANEEAVLEYKTELDRTDFQEGLNVNRQRDLYLQRTNFGIHRDDFHFLLGGAELKKLGSQGQQKSFIIALKLAQFEILKNHKGFKPILLLDDIFDKLDDSRIAKLLDLIRKDELGQLFITDARPDRTRELLEQVNVSATIFTVEKGAITTKS
ncbi:MAG TPA: DNA replication/repair protein RecF [Chryseosolibacter sp.]